MPGRHSSRRESPGHAAAGERSAPRALPALAIAAWITLAVAAAVVWGVGSNTLAWLSAGILAACLALVAARAERRGRPALTGPEAGLHDDLTGLPDELGFAQRAAAELSRARRRGTSLTVFCLDLEDFDRVRTELGDAEAEDILRRVSLEALAVLRGEDVLAHLGGGRFVALAPDIDRADQRRVLARITGAIERAVPGRWELRGAAAVVGSACYPGSADSVEELVAAARTDLEHVRAGRPEGRSRLETPLVEEESLQDCRLADTREPRWASRLTARRVAIGGVAGSLAIAAAWFAAPFVFGAVPARPIIVAAAQLAAIAALGVAAWSTSGRERAGWALLAAGLVVWYAPLLGLPAGLASAGGLLLILDGRWIGDRYRLLDLVGAGLAVGVISVALLVPALIDAGDPGAMLIASRASVGMLGAAITAAALMTFYWISIRTRPHAFLIAAGFLLGVATTSPWSLQVETATFVPSEPWELGLPLAALLVGMGALMRLIGPSAGPLNTESFDARTLDGAVIADALIVVVAIGVLIGGHPLTAVALVPLLLAIIIMRDIRSRLLERDRRQLRRTALRNRRELALQWRANLAVLSAALEARDGYTGRHSHETVKLARKVAPRLGLSKDAVEEVAVAALLHDIGKIGVPDDILEKPSGLSETEWKVMREHPVTGERILRAVPGLEQTATAIRHEHERWDGKGYPDGLAGPEIPLSSRIVFACDAFHAMVSDRPYRAALSAEEASARIEAGAGAQFDPAVVRALLDVLRSPVEGGTVRRARFARRRVSVGTPPANGAPGYVPGPPRGETPAPGV